MKKRFLLMVTVGGRRVPAMDSAVYTEVKNKARQLIKSGEAVQCEIITYTWMHSLSEERRERRFLKVEFLHTHRPGWVEE